MDWTGFEPAFPFHSGLLFHELQIACKASSTGSFVIIALVLFVGTQ